MICTSIDGYMDSLCCNQLMISWQITLTDGTKVYGDYDRPNFENPWIRLKEHCEKNLVYPAKIELHMFGVPHEVFFQNEKGLDGVFVMRGMAKDQSMDGSHSQSFQTMTVGLLRDDCSCIDISKYTWPISNFEQKQTTRVLTKENLEAMIFKHDSEKRKHPEVQKLLDGPTM
jgi:hypothetical protein